MGQEVKKVVRFVGKGIPFPFFRINFSQLQVGKSYLILREDVYGGIPLWILEDIGPVPESWFGKPESLFA